MISKTKQRTKNCIKESLTILLHEEKNINKISVKKLCNKIGINRSTFYLYYHDLNSVGEEIVNDIMHSLFKEYEVINSIEDIYNLIKYSIEYLENNNKDLLAYLYYDDISSVVYKFQKVAFNIIYNSKLIKKYNEKDFYFYLQFYLDGLLHGILSAIKQKDFTNIKEHSINLFNKLFI